MQAGKKGAFGYLNHNKRWLRVPTLQSLPNELSDYTMYFCGKYLSPFSLAAIWSGQFEAGKFNSAVSRFCGTRVFTA